ncbi:MAG: hypothetical protein ACTHK6_12100 [Solirubrobacterales bacterium]
MGETLMLLALLPRGEEAWEPVLFGGLIPLLGAVAVFLLIWYAVRKPPREDEPGDE